MEGPGPIPNTSKKTEKVLYNNKEYLLNIIISYDKKYLIIKIESSEIENSDSYFEIRYNIQDLYSLNKYFRQFDTIYEVVKALENNQKIIREKLNLQPYALYMNNSDMYLSLHLYLMTGETQIINIKLNSIRKTEKEINEDLKAYIQFIKSIPGVNELIINFNKNNNHFIFEPRSNIIQRDEDFNFIYQELSKRLNKTEIKLVQRFNVLRDGDTSKLFHLKCNNIGPNLSIIKTKENIIFGGFTMNNWSTEIKQKKDDLSFIFHFQNKKIYEIKKGQFSIWCDNGSLINFYNGKGGASTLRVNDVCLSNEYSNTCKISDTSFKGFCNDFELNNRKQCFSVFEFEIYEVV